MPAPLHCAINHGIADMYQIGPKTGLRVLLIAILIGLLGACGMKGDLYLPDGQNQPPRAKKPEQKKEKDTPPDSVNGEVTDK